MAARGGAGSENMFQLLPSDRKGIEEADIYAKKRRTQLDSLKINVENMGWFGTFMDSKVPQEDRGILNISFSHTNPKKIEAEIRKCLDFYQMMVAAVEKIENENKTEAEIDNPYLIIINLNRELTELFEVAQSGIQKTDSKTVSRLYTEFLSKQSELENKIKKLECAFLKQQLSTDRDRNETYRSNAARMAEDGIAHQERRMTEMAEEVNDLRSGNEDLRRVVDSLTERLDALLP